MRRRPSPSSSGESFDSDFSSSESGIVAPARAPRAKAARGGARAAPRRGRAAAKPGVEPARGGAGDAPVYPAWAIVPWPAWASELAAGGVPKATRRSSKADSARLPPTIDMDSGCVLEPLADSVWASKEAATAASTGASGCARLAGTITISCRMTALGAAAFDAEGGALAALAMRLEERDAKAQRTTGRAKEVSAVERAAEEAAASAAAAARAAFSCACGYTGDGENVDLHATRRVCV
jgi:hypothetical protein